MADANGSADHLSLVLFSGTDDKLTAASILVAGAAALGKRVDILLQYWALEVFKKDCLEKDHGLSPEAGPGGASLLWRAGERGAPHWSETLRQAKDLGEVRLHACAHSLELFGLEQSDLDPLVDDVSGVASFMADAEGQMVFV